MAFTDYIDLRTAVIEQVGDASIADVFDRLTLLAEARLNRRLRTSQQITETTVTISGGTATLPSDFLSAAGLFDTNGYEYIAQPSPSARITGAHRHYYTIENGAINMIDASGNKTLVYYAKLPTLTTSDTTTNWLLDDYPSVYLYAIAFEAAKHMRDAEQAEAFRQLMNEEIDELVTDDNRKRYSRARVRVQGPIV